MSCHAWIGQMSNLRHHLQPILVQWEQKSPLPARHFSEQTQPWKSITFEFGLIWFNLIVAFQIKKTCHVLLLLRSSQLQNAGYDISININEDQQTLAPKEQFYSSERKTIFLHRKQTMIPPCKHKIRNTSHQNQSVHDKNQSLQDNKNTSGHLISQQLAHRISKISRCH